MNFDDHNTQEFSYGEQFDPDINEIIGYDSLPPFVWRFSTCNRRDSMEACGAIDSTLDENSKINAF